MSAVAELLAKNPEPWARRFLIGERVTDKLICRIIIARQAYSRSDPQLTVMIAIETGYNIAIQGSGIIRLREICREAVAIIFVQAVVGRNPDIAVLILTYIIDETTGKTFR